MEYIVKLVLLFFAYSLAGWLIEVTLKFIQYHRFINRGFFTGPICPIYGSGAVLISVCCELLNPYEYAYGTTFALSFALCGTVEYFTSYFMEKRFHARWWDYSNKPMNLHGRIWIGNLILFGLGGVAIVHFINPLLYKLFSLVALQVKEIVSAALLALFIADYILTHFILKLIKTGVEKSEADNTEQINREIRALLSDKSVLYKRFADAYPEVIYRTERINAHIAKVKAEAERMRREAEGKIGKTTQKLADILEPSALIKSTVIDKQARLIDMLYDDSTANNEIKALKSEIDSDVARLEAKPIKQIYENLSAKGVKVMNRSKDE